MNAVLWTCEPPLCGVTLRGHIEEVFDVARRIEEHCGSSIRNVDWLETDDDDEAIVTFSLCPHHKLTETRVNRIIDEQNANDIMLTLHHNNGADHVGSTNT